MLLKHCSHKLFCCYVFIHTLPCLVLHTCSVLIRRRAFRSTRRNIAASSQLLFVVGWYGLPVRSLLLSVLFPPSVAASPRIMPNPLTVFWVSAVRVWLRVTGSLCSLWLSKTSCVYLRHRSKKQKTESLPQINVSSTVTGANEMRQNFVAAVKCWELLHSSETLEKGSL